MQISEAGLRLIQDSEGCKLQSYLCPAGKWTIGWGHTSEAGPPMVGPGMTISQADADAILVNDAKHALRDVMSQVTVPLSQGQMDALVDFTFNFGIGRLRESTFLKLLNAGKYDQVPAQLMRWTKARDPNTGELVDLPGLVKRRRAECSLWRGTDDNDPEISQEEMRATPEPPVPDKSIFQSKEAIAGATTIGAAAVPEIGKITDQIEQANSLATAVHHILHGPTIWIALVIMIAGGCVIFFRNKKLKETGL